MLQYKLKKYSLRLVYLLTAVFFLLNAKESFSQNNYGYEYAEKKSGELFLNKKWDELIAFGKKALKDKIDFYYLRVRLGTAYYKKNQYLYASENFEKAQDFGYEESSVMEMLYFSYLKTGREDDAEYVFTRLPETNKYRIRPLNNAFINNVIAISGTGISNDINRNSEASAVTGDEGNVYSEQTLNGNKFFINAGIKQIPVERVSVFYDYTYINQEKEKQYFIDSNTYSDSYSEIQNRFYNKLDILAGRGFVVSPAFQYINKRYTTFFLNYDSIAEYSMYDNTSGKADYSFTDEETNQDDFVLSLELIKYVSLFRFALNGSFSYLNENHQSQTGLSFTYFPNGKTDFYLTTNAVLHFQNNVTNLIGTQLFGGRVLKNIYTNAFVTFGNISNYNEQNAFTVFNDPDRITLNFGAEVKYNILENFSAYFLYSNQQHERDIVNYEETGEGNSPVSSEVLKYQLNSVSAGLKFTF